uniref:(northern house mosquito) hypothetical protein n=1 Tax=Culex pipiens TaxID=7175 RepID=A0A8D8GX32_CULPI
MLKRLLPLLLLMLLLNVNSRRTLSWPPLEGGPLLGPQRGRADTDARARLLLLLLNVVSRRTYRGRHSKAGPCSDLREVTRILKHVRGCCCAWPMWWTQMVDGCCRPSPAEVGQFRNHVW